MDVTLNVSEPALHYLTLAICTIAIVIGLLRYMDTFWD